MITNVEFLNGGQTFLDSTKLRSEYSQIIAKWCLQFYKKYNKPIGKNLRNWFEQNKKTLKEDTSELIESLLIELDTQYKNKPDFNIEYLLDQAELFFKEQEVNKLANNIQVLVEQGKILEAENEIATFHKVKKTGSNFYNPFDSKEVFRTLSNKKKGFFSLYGNLGKYMGHMDRGWLIGISGAFKRGKTYFAMEFFTQAFLSGKKAAFFSLEMAKNQINDRFYKRLFPYTQRGVTFNPVFDCWKNQIGECGFPERKSKTFLYYRGQEKPEFRKVKDYYPCTFCLKERPEDYTFETWWELVKTSTENVDKINKTIQAVNKTFSDKARIKCYPRFSANVRDIITDLNILEQEEDFVPDVIVIDYADILKPEDERLIGVEKEDRTWIALAQLAQERRALVVTPTQITRDGQEAKNIKAKHSAKWVGKLGHVDSMFTMNQTEKERDSGILRVGLTHHRHAEIPSHTCSILQNLDISQFCLDANIIKDFQYLKENNKDKTKK